MCFHLQYDCMTSCVSLTSTFFFKYQVAVCLKLTVSPRCLRGNSNIHKSKLFLFIAPFHTKHLRIDMAHVLNNRSTSCERMMKSNGEDPNQKEPNACECLILSPGFPSSCWGPVVSPLKPMIKLYKTLSSFQLR